MKRIILFVLCLAVAGVMFAQKISSTNLVCAGGNMSNSEVSVLYSIGEIATETFYTGNYYSYQGFQQTSTNPFQGQAIILNQGWNLLSTYIEPLNYSISILFSGLGNELLILKDENGEVYWPEYSINNIGNSTTGEAYQAKLSDDKQLNIIGTGTVPELTPIVLPLGWSFIGYLRQTPIPLLSVFSSIAGYTNIVKDNNGNVFWPQWYLNQIGNLLPGQGYQVKMNQAQVITYTPN